MAQNSKHISIIIPVYNDGKSIRSIISKILSETRIEIELIIVNDGSTDNTSEIVTSFHDPRIILISQENKGVYSARNAALNRHTGKWVMFLDADDDFENDMIFQRVKTAERENIDVLITNGKFVNSTSSRDGKLIHTKQIYNKSINGNEWIRNAVNKNEWPHYLWLQLVSSNYLKENNLTFNAGHSHQDILWSTMLALKNGRFYISQESDYYYVSNPSSITNSNKYYDRRALNYIEVISKLISYSKNHSNLKPELLKHSVHECRHFIGLYRKKIRDKKMVSNIFFEKVDFSDLWKGATTLKQHWLIIRLYFTLKLGSLDNITKT